jgi:RNA polymerase sigma-70 factor (ECF subfamily)
MEGMVNHDREHMMTEREVDKTLVIRAQAGERVAFDQLVIKYRRRLLRVISTIVRNQADAEDVLQDAFLLAFRGIPYFRAEAGFYTWLFRIGVNRAKSFEIAKRRHVSIEFFTESDQREEATFDGVCDQSPLTALENKESIVALDRVLEGMPPTQSAALFLLGVEGLSYQEIARAAKVPIGTIRSRIFRARKLIAEALTAQTGSCSDPLHLRAPPGPDMFV